MAAAKDYKSSATLDLVITGGDFVQTDSDYQASLLLMNSNKGSFKLHPLAGMGIRRYEGSSNSDQIIKREIRVQHIADGLEVEALIVKDFTFNLALKRPGYE